MKGHPTILAVDPGDTTGWVRVAVPLGRKPVEVLLERWGTFTGLREELDSEYLMYHDADYIVCEDYMIYPDPQVMLANVGSKLHAVRVMGRVERCAQLHSDCPEEFVPDLVTYQTASKAKQWWPDTRLKLHFPTHKLYPTGKPRPGHVSLCRHECDALRHAMTFVEDHFNVQLVVINASTIV